MEVRKELTDEWQRAGIHDTKDFAMLTDIMTKKWSGKTTREYKVFKDLKKERLDELEATKSDLEVQILQEQMQKPPLDREQLTFWTCRFRETDITMQEQRQRLVDIFVNSVYVFDDHMTVNFNYREGTVTILPTQL